ncbi:MAG TPA: hypothetical protein VGE34_00830 [Candidatus Saccharimonadales bacterium]
MKDKDELTRKEYMKHGEGIVRNIAVSVVAQAVVIEGLNAERDTVRRGDIIFAEHTSFLPKGVQGLCLLARQLSENVKITAESVEFRTKVKEFISESQRSDDGGKFLYWDGTGDQDFTWHFAPWLVSRCMYSFVEHGVLSQDALETLDLKDVADMMRQEWFYDLVRDMAFAGNGTYGTVGTRVGDFAPNFGMMSLFGETEEVYRYEGYDYPDALEVEIDKSGIAKARLQKEFREKIRETMKNANGGSIGCPVAHEVFQVEGDTRQSPYIAQLVRDGRIEQIDGHRYRQVSPLISETLDLVADYIEDYGVRYGQPFIESDENGLRVAHRPLDVA